MGEVFLAKQVGPSGFEKLLVIKRILAHHHDKSDYLNMFLSEARLVARLTHSNIIQIHEMGQIDGDYFIAMEYVRGKSLRDIIDALRHRGQQMPLAYVIDLAIKLCEGMGYAHEAQDLRGRPMNIIHRDVNPHNILISYSGDLKLIDFGIAKSEMASVNTATGTIKGKFVYMSPEQSAADPIDSRSDIFSLGIVLYELATLENPFVRQNVVLSLEAIQRHPVDLPETKRPSAKALNDILKKTLNKNPDERYQTCFELRDDLRGLFRSATVAPEENDIAIYLNELFDGEIKEEDLLLAEADSATSPPVSARPRSTLSPYPIDDDDDDSEITRSGRPPTAQPHPITTRPFADDEATMSGDDRKMAARSRQQSGINKVLSLLDTADEFDQDISAYDNSDPHTRSERIPSEIRRWGDTNYRAANSTADVPANSVPAESSPAAAESVAAFDEPLSAVESLWSARNEETREIRKGSVPSSSPARRNSIFDSFGPSNTLRTSHAEFDMEREPSVSLPIYVGAWRRTMVVSSALLFCVTVALGYWLTLKFAKNSKPATKTVLNAAPERGQPKLNLVPAPDPVFVPSPPAKIAPGKTTSERPTKTISRRSKRDEREKNASSAKPKRRRQAGQTKQNISSKRSYSKTSGKRTSASRKPKRRKAAKKKKNTSVKNQNTETPPISSGNQKTGEKESKSLSDGKHGGLMLRSSIPVALSHNGGTVHNPSSLIPMNSEQGRLKLSGDRLPFVIDLKYDVTAGGISVRLECSPWAIVKHNGIALGKTPQGPVAPGRRHRFSFLRPGQRKPIVVSLKWNPKVR